MTGLRACKVALRTEPQPILAYDTGAMVDCDLFGLVGAAESMTTFSAANGTLSRQRPITSASLRVMTSSVMGI